MYMVQLFCSAESTLSLDPIVAKATPNSFEIANEPSFVHSFALLQRLFIEVVSNY